MRWFDRSRESGRLSPAGCVTDVSRPVPGCGASTGMRGAFGIAVAPNGDVVYVGSRDSSAVVTFHRGSATGRLEFLDCVSGDDGYRHEAGCRAARALQYVQYVTVSPDGRSLYASATDSHSIGVFRSWPHTQPIEQLVGPAGCLHDVAYPGRTPCNPAQGLALPLGTSLSGNGRYLYAAAFGYGAVTSFGRDPRTGVLWQLGTCVGSDPRCPRTGHMDRAGQLVVTHEGRDVYVVAASSGTVTELTRRTG